MLAALMQDRKPDRHSQANANCASPVCLNRETVLHRSAAQTDLKMIENGNSSLLMFLRCNRSRATSPYSI